MKRLKLIERKCTQCHGSGAEPSGDCEWFGYLEESCTTCGGSGTVYDNKKLANNGFIVLDVVY